LACKISRIFKSRLSLQPSSLVFLHKISNRIVLLHFSNIYSDLHLLRCSFRRVEKKSIWVGASSNPCYAFCCRWTGTNLSSFLFYCSSSGDNQYDFSNYLVILCSLYDYRCHAFWLIDDCYLTYVSFCWNRVAMPFDFLMFLSPLREF